LAATAGSAGAVSDASVTTGGTEAVPDLEEVRLRFFLVALGSDFNFGRRSRRCILGFG